MPRNGPPWLSGEDTQLIADWIAQGAHNAQGQPAPVIVGARVRLGGMMDGQGPLDGLPLHMAPGARLDKMPRAGEAAQVRGRVGEGWRWRGCGKANLFPSNPVRIVDRPCLPYDWDQERYIRYQVSVIMTELELSSAFQPLWSDIDQAGTFPQKRPLLAHYTSIATLESIVRNEEIWFSNPLFMNDIDELKFGMLEGARAFRESSEIRKACQTDERYRMVRDSFEFMFGKYDSEHVFDTYIFCLSEHNAAVNDGRLSMWRGYGGNGHGAAIIFDTSKIDYVEGNVPLVVSQVTYMTTMDRRAWIDRKIAEFAKLISECSAPKEMLHIPVYHLFERIKMFALFTKHDGFSEEAEWRVAFLKERDIGGVFDGMLSYAIGRGGVEPKLKFKVRPIDGYTSSDLSLEKIVSQIILGPMMASPLAVNSVKRMLQSVGKASLADRVSASTTPFRPQ